MIAREMGEDITLYGMAVLCFPLLRAHVFSSSTREAGSITIFLTCVGFCVLTEFLLSWAGLAWVIHADVPYSTSFIKSKLAFVHLVFVTTTFLLATDAAIS